MEIVRVVSERWRSTEQLNGMPRKVVAGSTIGTFPAANRYISGCLPAKIRKEFGVGCHEALNQPNICGASRFEGMLLTVQLHDSAAASTTMCPCSIPTGESRVKFPIHKGGVFKIPGACSAVL
jgi:hypothetical protein